MWQEPIAREREAFDARDFRNALGAFPTGVCIVTTVGPGGKREGLTVNSFSSVSLHPPMVLWSIVRRAPSAAVFRDAEFFAVSVLAADDEALSSHFARPAADKFEVCADRFSAGIGGVPVLAGAVATFECRNQFQNYGGDHIVFIGTVERYGHCAKAPLVFHRGRYARVASDPVPAP